MLIEACEVEKVCHYHHLGVSVFHFCAHQIVTFPHEGRGTASEAHESDCAGACPCGHDGLGDLISKYVLFQKTICAQMYFHFSLVLRLPLLSVQIRYASCFLRHDEESAFWLSLHFPLLGLV